MMFSGLHHAGAASFQIFDAAEFSKIVDTNSVFTTNATINSGLEGPVWIPSGGGYLIFCDRGNNRLKKLVPPSTVSDFLVPPTNTLYNGTMLDTQERLLACQAGGAGLRVVMITNNVVTMLASTCNGLKFYSPNDLVVKSDGTVWFTDPGINGGIGAPPQPGFEGGYYVYQFNPTNGNATCTPVITNGIARPNGLCFSPDETKLYVCDSYTNAHHILVYSVTASNTLTGGSLYVNITNGVPDGIRCDADGRVWSSSGEGVYIFAPDGHLIGKILFGKISNLCFGGPEYKTIYMTGQPTVTSLPVLVAGTPSIKILGFNFDGSQMNLSWPAPSTGFVLQQADQPGNPAAWTNADVTALVTNAQNVVGVETTNSATFFRLRLN
jgi:gluconolactonase